MNKELNAFKAYDIRGKYPEEINESLAYRIGQAFSKFLKAKTVVIGHDIRISSCSLSNSLLKGLNSEGTKVIDIGLCGTEMIYFATSFLKADGGIMITASHNPKEYNGMKFVQKNSVPISGDSGLNKIKEYVELPTDQNTKNTKNVVNKNIFQDYADYILKLIDIKNLKPLKIVCNAGNGIGGLIANAIEESLPFNLIKLNFKPDGSFPNGVPNPLLPENREATAKAVIKYNADFGVAWDGDADRCFLYDENGKFVEGYYMVGLLAKTFLTNNKNEKIIHDPRLIWNTIDIVNQMGGIPIMSKTGHAFIKERMRKEDAIYGGEMSAHHYFRDFFFCDSGMLPWLLVAELICKTEKKLSEMVSVFERNYPISGEINSKVQDPDLTIKEVEKRYKEEARNIDYTDGLSMDMGKWRFNLRKSNTEPLVRLNVESKADKKLMQEKTDELLKLIRC